MPRPTIHPGEILADELAELGITAAELARQIDVPPQPPLADHSWPPRDHRRHGPAPGPLVRHQCAVLDQPAGRLGLRLAEARQGDAIARLPRRPSDGERAASGAE